MTSSEHIADQQLVSDAVSGQRAAFEALVARYGGKILALVERQVQEHHHALDLCQEIWIKVFRALPHLNTSGSFRSWLFSVTLNHVRDAMRSRKRQRVVYLDQFRRDPAAARHADPKGQVEEKAVIEEALAEISEPYRSAVLLVDVNGLTYEEAAIALKAAVGTVKSRVNRGRLAFRDHYVRLSGADTNPPKRSGQSGWTS